MKTSTASSAIVGAAFLMATSAIGPGFITQTTVFTDQLRTSFGFVILCSILLDIVSQLNIWRIITVSGLNAQVYANKLLPGIGYFLSALVLFGGLAFNVGNIAGTGLGLNVLFGLTPLTGAIISTVVALIIFWFREFGAAMDWFSKIFGFVMIGLTMFVAIKSHPPVGEALHRSFVPLHISPAAIVTLVGGTVGGYISFAGAHRLLDAGIKGKSQIKRVTRSSITAILIASTMRILLFLASLGVIVGGGILNRENPAASVFEIAAGELGYRIFGIVLWSAAITSVVGSAYTSISFFRTFHPLLNRQHRLVTSAFIVLSTIIFSLAGQPVKLLIIAGAVNGLILPVSLAVILAGTYKKSLIPDYRHPQWMLIGGWIVVAMMFWLGYLTIAAMVGKL